MIPKLLVFGKGGGVPAWRFGADLAWDFVNGLYYGGAVAPTDTHSGTIYELDSAGVLQPVTANTLVRTNLGAQVTPTRTNLVTYSTASNAAHANLNGSLGAVAGGVVAPITGQTPFAWIDNTTNAEHQLAFSPTLTVAANTTHTLSFIIKPESQTFFRVYAYASPGYGSGLGASFNFSTLVVTSLTYGTATYTSGSITAIGNGWYYCTLVGKIDATSTAMDPQIYANTAAYAGTTVTVADIGLMQIEAASFASPPIVTVAAAVTLNGNQQVVTPSQSYASGAATEITVNVLGLNDGDWLWQDNDASANNRAGIRQNSGQFQFIVDSGGVNQAAMNLGAVSTGVKSFAAVYGANYAMAQLVGGTPPTADTVVTMPVSETKFNLGGNGFNATNNGYAQMRGASKKFEVASAATFTASLGRATAQASFFP